MGMVLVNHMYKWVGGSGQEASVGGKVPISLENDLW
jgi:hypothetical protein